jgi:hypothetical protein
LSADLRWQNLRLRTSWLANGAFPGIVLQDAARANSSKIYQTVNNQVEEITPKNHEALGQRAVFLPKPAEAEHLTGGPMHQVNERED